MVPRQSSFPFITGDTFREIADCVLDDSDCPFDPSVCANFPGAVVFLKIDFEDTFFREYHARMPHPYVLVSSNSDFDVPHSSLGEHVLFANDPMLLAWFSPNTRLVHPKLRVIPRGLRNVGRPDILPATFREYFGGQEGHPLHETHKRWRDKLAFSPRALENETTCPFRCSFAFNDWTNLAERSVLRAHLVREGFVPDPVVSLDKFMREGLAASHFTFSPPGNAADCHRHMEAVLSGSVPVVRRGLMEPVFARVPHVAYDDVQELTCSRLVSEWARIQREFADGGFDFGTMYAEHWILLIYKAAGRVGPLSEIK